MSLPADTIYPVILPVPEIDRQLKGREKVKSLSRYARLALEQSCAKSGLRLEDLPKDDQGVPLPVDGVYWSLSHKSAIVGGVAATLPVGLDLETVRPVNQALLARIADDPEWRLAGNREAASFFRFWTAKEAVLKAVGKGMAGLSRCRIVAIETSTRMILTYDNLPWPVEHRWFGDHVAAMAVQQDTVVWSLSS
ncbi:4'-phosphopantetheinyl transferase superfamily protein [uncultured Desulfosarcina sp.]|uniref:4'-phosphopantetheinyl transferase family protein n=1 Tax=uncultured Desulfosarcina sp. TaxID=218289 RepID=UPI0029C919A0|nr:4'-phosphopantetheinyl transferase superfamily protein [uncultured Desulfosarcina sp.]